MHFCTICEIIFLVGGPWKSNVVLEKSLKNGCIFCMNPINSAKVVPFLVYLWSIYDSYSDFVTSASGVLDE